MRYKKLTKKLRAACHAGFTFARYLRLAESDMYLSLGPTYITVLYSLRRLSYFNFQWTKTLYQNILSHITFFLHFSGAVDIIVLITQFPDGFHLNYNSLSLTSCLFSIQFKGR